MTYGKEFKYLYILLYNNQLINKDDDILTKHAKSILAITIDCYSINTPFIKNFFFFSFKKKQIKKAMNSIPI